MKVLIPGDVTLLSLSNGVIKRSLMGYVPHCLSFDTPEFESVEYLTMIHIHVNCF